MGFPAFATAQTSSTAGFSKFHKSGICLIIEDSFLLLSAWNVIWSIICVCPPPVPSSLLLTPLSQLQCHVMHSLTLPHPTPCHILRYMSPLQLLWQCPLPLITWSEVCLPPLYSKTRRTKIISVLLQCILST